MELLLKILADSFLIPPGVSVVVLVAGLVCLRFFPRAGVAIISLGAFSLYAFSTPFMAAVLIGGLSKYPALTATDLQQSGAQAIVILAGGRDSNATEYGGDTVSEFTLQRIRYGAWLNRRTSLPLLVSGGRLRSEQHSEAELMRDTLQKEFIVRVNWVETESKNTFENAKYSYEILQRAGISRIFLVTHGLHMPRAVEAYEHFGLQVIAAPTVLEARTDNWPEVRDFFPNSWGVRHSAYAMHEIIGRMWYHIRHF